MIHRRISDSPDPAPPENSGEPDSTIASRDPPPAAEAGFILLIMCCRNSNDPSLIRGNPPRGSDSPSPQSRPRP